MSPGQPSSSGGSSPSGRELRPLPRLRRIANTSCDASREEQDAWVTTYMDLITLLLTLFVVLLAYADKGKEEYQAISRGMAEGLDSPLVLSPLSGKGEPSGAELMEQKLRQFIELSGMSEEVSLVRHGDELRVELSEKILFASGEARFSAGAAAILVPIISLLKEGNDTITVEGHTDNVPIANQLYPSNWELSAARASYLVRHFIAEGVAPVRLRAVGYADTRPIADNGSEAGRKRNRRVTLLIAPEIGKG